MNQHFLRAILLLGFVFITTGFFFKSKLPDENMPKVPSNMPDHSISENFFHQRLVESYDQGLAHERVKIDYLMTQVKASPFTFNRNGLNYDGQKTAKHLIKKYRKRVAEIRTARQFIETIATKSSMSGKHYLADPGDGFIYYAANLLHYELDRVEAYLKDHHLQQARNRVADIEKVEEEVEDIQALVGQQES